MLSRLIRRRWPIPVIVLVAVLGVVSVADHKLLRIVKAGSDPEQTAVSSDGSRLFVANEDVGEASVVSVDDGHVLARLKVGGEPEGVEMRPDGQVVYVTSEEDSHVAVIDAKALKVLKTLEVLGARGARSRADVADAACPLPRPVRLPELLAM